MVETDSASAGIAESDFEDKSCQAASKKDIKFTN